MRCGKSNELAARVATSGRVTCALDSPLASPFGEVYAIQICDHSVSTVVVGQWGISAFSEPWPAIVAHLDFSFLFFMAIALQPGCA